MAWSSARREWRAVRAVLLATLICIVASLANAQVHHVRYAGLVPITVSTMPCLTKAFICNTSFDDENASSDDYVRINHFARKLRVEIVKIVLPLGVNHHFSRCRLLFETSSYKFINVEIREERQFPSVDSVNRQIVAHIFGRRPPGVLEINSGIDHVPDTIGTNGRGSADIGIKGSHPGPRFLPHLVQLTRNEIGGDASGNGCQECESGGERQYYQIIRIIFGAISLVSFAVAAIGVYCIGNRSHMAGKGIFAVFFGTVGFGLSIAGVIGFWIVY